MGLVLTTLCYLKDSGKTLMMHRIKKKHDVHQGKWNGLGGKFNPGENPEECALREIKEESGLTPKKLILKGVLTFPQFKPPDDWYVFLFIGMGFIGTLTDSSEGTLEWVPDEKILDRPLWDGDRIFIPWLNQERFFSGKFVYKHKELEAHEVVFY